MPEPLMTPRQCFERWPVPQVAGEEKHVDWFDDASHFGKIACGDNPHDLRAHKVIGPIHMLAKRSSLFLAVHAAVHRALSFRRAFGGSPRDEIGALALSNAQNPDGSWVMGMPLVMEILSGYRSPFSSFLVLRTIPLLTRTQGADGLWGDPRSTIMILRSLKAHGFLDAALPAGKEGRPTRASRSSRP